MPEFFWKIMEKAWPWMRPHRQVIIPIFFVGFLVGVVAGGFLIYYLVYIKVDSINSQLTAERATVSTLQETIGRYEMRLGINKEHPLTVYDSFSNAQLKQKAFNLVKDYRSMKIAHDLANINLKARHERGEFSRDKLNEYIAGEEARVLAEYESAIANDTLLTVLQLRLRIPEKDRSGIIHFNLNPADPRGQKVPFIQAVPSIMAFQMSGDFVREMDLLAKLLKD